MRKVVYYVAVSLDGFICGPGADISGFISSGNGVQKYISDLQDFDTVIMGRKTYTFGYAFGLKPGQPAYPHMKHYIFSHSLSFDSPHANVIVKPVELAEVDQIQQMPGSDIYLCGGGEFAGWLLDHQRVDVLKIKLNPFIQGEGVRLFGNCKKQCKTQLLETTRYEEGMQIMTYKMIYQ